MTMGFLCLLESEFFDDFLRLFKDDFFVGFFACLRMIFFVGVLRNFLCGVWGNFFFVC